VTHKTGSGKRRRKKTVCSFCGGKGTPRAQLVQGGFDEGSFICENCVTNCAEIYASVHKAEAPIAFHTPREIKELLDEYVIGQDAAKRTISVAVFNHYKRLFFKKSQQDSDVELEKSNILLLGPTGTGKTLMARTLAKLLNVPFTIADATTLTEAGYVGEDVENVVLQLLRNASYDIARSEWGIVYIDEIDKIGRTTGNVSITRDVSGEGVQQALLKIIEGTVCNVPPKGGRKHPHQEYIRVDTTNILFICGGAFNGLEKIVERRLGKRVVGFDVTREMYNVLSRHELLKKASPEDLIEYGLIPEFAGRLPVTTALDELSKDDLVRVLTEPRNALIRQYEALFALEGVELEFSPEVLETIASRAVKRGTGARGLRSMMEHVMTDLMYDLPEREGLRKCIINTDFVEGDVEQPEMVFADRKVA